MADLADDNGKFVQIYDNFASIVYSDYICAGSLVDVEVNVKSDVLTAWTMDNDRPDGECIINTTIRSTPTTIRAGGEVR